MSTQQSDNGEPDEFARTDPRTGQPAPERSPQMAGHDVLGRLMARVTPARAVVAATVTLILTALVAAQLGYTQRLVDAARYRIQMMGVPELTETTIASQPATHLTTAKWEKIALPAPASRLIDYSADPTDPESLLVCGLSSLEKSTTQGEVTPRGPIALWLTRDAGKTWTQSQSPAISGTYCWISRAPGAPQQLAVLIEHPSSLNPRCSEHSVLLSDNSGASWQTTPMTSVTTRDVVQFCMHFPLLIGQRLYVFTTWSQPLSGQGATNVKTSVAYSEDGGGHWSRVNGDSAQLLGFRLAFLANSTIITVRWPAQQEDSENASALWTSQDRGDSWHPLNKLHGIAPDQVLLSFGAQSAHATADQPLYLAARSHFPSRLLALKAAQIVDNRHWAYLPPLPVKGASADHIGVTSTLGVTASGKLLAFGVSPTADIQSIGSSEKPLVEQWLWSWDPHAQRWTSLAPPLPVEWKLCSDGCWRASIAQSATNQQTVLWVRGYVSENNANELYRLALPAKIA
jgi:hypothetical protein